MVDSTVPKAGVMPAPPRVVLGRERLLGVTEIRELTGLGEVAAASLMKESGRCLKHHQPPSSSLSPVFLSTFTSWR